MRIAHVCDSMEMGGAEKVIAMLCRMQRQAGDTCSVECLYKIGILGEGLLAEGVEVNLHQPPTFLGLMISLYREFRSFRPDVVHLHNATAAIIGALPARLAGVHCIIATRHGLVAKPYPLRREIKFAAACRFCDWVVGVSQETTNNLSKAPFAIQNKISRVYNGAPPIPNGKPHSKSGTTLLHVGRLHAAKDQSTMLRALALARRRLPDIRLWIVGDGPLMPKLQGLVHELGLEGAVTFFGEQPDTASFYRAADLFVMSSVTEGLPIVLLEAMSAGLPAVVTNVGGMGEIARLGAAIVVSPSDAAALADAIVKTLESPGSRMRLGKTAYLCYKENFTPAKMLSGYMRLYTGGV